MQFVLLLNRNYQLVIRFHQFIAFGFSQHQLVNHRQHLFRQFLDAGIFQLNLIHRFSEGLQQGFEVFVFFEEDEVECLLVFYFLSQLMILLTGEHHVKLIIHLASCQTIQMKYLQQINKAMMNSYSYLFKYIIIGDASVGKSCILMQFLEGKFKVDSETTVGVQFGSKIIDISQERIKLQIWDTAGQQVFKSITRSYYRGSIGAILMYDITSKLSFNNLQKWIDETKSYANQKLTVILVGNKNDLDSKRQVSALEAQAFADEHKMLFMQCSAKDHEQTCEIFTSLGNQILKKIEEKEIDPKNENLGVKVGTYKPLTLRNDVPKPMLACCWQ